MPGKKRSGLANDRRAYGCCIPPPKYAVTYNGNTNTSGAVPTDNSLYLARTPIQVLGNSSLAKSGFIFAGWNTAADGSGTAYVQGNTFIIGANITLYAQWIPVYTVTYNGNGNTSGTVPSDGASPYVDGVTVTVLGNSGLAKTGFTFAGWNTATDGSGNAYSSGNTFAIHTNITLYAQWTPVVTLAAPTALSSVGGNQAAYILFTQSGTVTNYEYSTDDGVTYLPFNPPQIYSPVEITTLSSDGVTRLTNGTMYSVKLKAVNNSTVSNESVSVNVTPTVTSLLSTNRIIYLDANNSSSYAGTGTTWTNLESSGAYSATLTGSPTFNTTTPGNKYFEFNPGAVTGQYAQINQAAAINPVIGQAFTVQLWVKIDDTNVAGSLVGKMHNDARGYDGYNFVYTSNSELRLDLNGSRYDSKFTSSTSVLSSGWALYTANVQFGGTNKLFVNGRQVMTATNLETAISNPDQNLTLISGFRGDGKCSLGQFYYYNTELTPTQIIQNFDATKHAYM